MKSILNMYWELRCKDNTIRDKYQTKVKVQENKNGGRREEQTRNQKHWPGYGIDCSGKKVI